MLGVELRLVLGREFCPNVLFQFVRKWRHDAGEFLQAVPVVAAVPAGEYQRAGYHEPCEHAVLVDVAAADRDDAVGRQRVVGALDAGRGVVQRDRDRDVGVVVEVERNQLAADARAVVELNKTFNMDAQKLAKESLSAVSAKAA